ncbi:MAG: hypothetical protein IT292_04520 [Deltaproteobacteria bacterium]|nr:hypothetical protein [Deltaproteobacteria bacterium]
MSSENQNSTTASNAEPKPGHLWYVDEFLFLAYGQEENALADKSLETTQRFRLLDFIVSPGHICAKILENNNNIHKVEIVIAEFDEQVWQDFFLRAAKHAYVLAKMLSGDLCPEVKGIFSEMDLNLIPIKQEHIHFFLNNQPTNAEDPYISALIQRFVNRMTEDHFSIFLLRGCGHEELLAKLRSTRRQLKPNIQAEAAIINKLGATINSEPLHLIAFNNFWSAGEELENLTFSIKADELPAAILKWLDPLPLGGYEEQIERQLEENYAQVATRAHAFGLGL